MAADKYSTMFEVEQTHWWYRGMRHNTRQILRRYLTPGRTYQILDAGCGTGGNTLDLQRWGVVTAMDFSLEALGFATTRGLRRLLRGSVEELPFRDRSFDAVISLDVISDGGVKDELNALREFHRVLRPGGIALVRLPAFDWLWGAHDEAVLTVRRFTTRQLSERMRRAGFTVLEASYGNVVLFPLAIAKRLSERVLRSAPADLTVPAKPINSLFEAALRLDIPLSRVVKPPAGLSTVAVGRA